MDQIQNVLLKVGMAASNNKYLKSIKNAFQRLLPLTMAGAVAILWSNVLVNDQTGL